MKSQKSDLSPVCHSCENRNPVVKKVPCLFRDDRHVDESPLFWVMFWHTSRLFAGATEIRGFNHEILFYFKRLEKRKTCNNRQNYYIVILFLGLISLVLIMELNHDESR
jgi:hypothetical protein